MTPTKRPWIEKITYTHFEVGELVVPWEDLSWMAFKDARDLADKHDIVLNGPPQGAEGVASMHAHRFYPEMQTEMTSVARGIEQAILNGQAGMRLLEDIKTTGPVVFSRERAFNTATEYQNLGHFVEQLFKFPSGNVQALRSYSFEPGRAKRIQSTQSFLHKLTEYVRAQSGLDPAVLESMAGFKSREPLETTDHTSLNLYIGARDLKTALKEATGLEERLALILDTTKHDITLHQYSLNFLKTPAGKKAARITGTWRNLWKSKPLFDQYEPAIQTIERVLLPADNEMATQLQREGYLKDGRLTTEGRQVALRHAHIQGALSLLGVDVNEPNKKPISEETGFSLGSLNPGNVFVYADGSQEFIDFESPERIPLEAMLFQRWSRAGIYGGDGLSLKIDGVDCEQKLLQETYNHLEKLPGTHPSFEAFKEQYNNHKIGFLLGLARRYQKYAQKEKKDPESMRSVKRFYYSWFVKELERQGRVTGPDDQKLEYLNGLFEAPLDTSTMEAVFEATKPAQRYRSEFSFKDKTIEDHVRTETAKRISEERTKRRRKGVLHTVLVAGTAALIGLSGMYSLAMTAENALITREKAAVETANKLIQKEKTRIARLKEFQEEDQQFEQAANIVRRYHLGVTPANTLEVLANNRLKTYVEKFWDWPGEPPFIAEYREKHKEAEGKLMAGYLAFIFDESRPEPKRTAGGTSENVDRYFQERETIRQTYKNPVFEGMARTGCDNLLCDLGRHLKAQEECKVDALTGVWRNNRIGIGLNAISSAINNSTDNWAWQKDKSFQTRVDNDCGFRTRTHWGERHQHKTAGSLNLLYYANQ